MSANKYIFAILACVCMIVMQSCSKNMTCVVTGTPGTEIYTTVKIAFWEEYYNHKYKGTKLIDVGTNLEHVGTIPSTGQAKIKLNRDYPTDFLFLQANADNPLIPMGLDYNKRNNGFRKTLMIISLPTLLPPFVLSLYMTNVDDVSDELALRKQQTANTDLYPRVMAASNPIDEINNLKPKQIKSSKKARKSRPSQTGLSQLVNQSGTFKVVKTLDILSPKNGRTIQRIPFNGTITFNCLADNSQLWDITVEGNLNDGDEKVKLFIPIKWKFKKSGAKWVTKDKKGNPIEISMLSNGHAVINFTFEEVPMKVEYDPETWQVYELDDDDVHTMIMDLLGI